MQRYRCTHCGKTFSESQPLDGLRLDHGKVIQIVKLLTEGLGVRATARFVDCDPHTVLGVLVTVGHKCDQFHDKEARHITTGALQIDELHARVGGDIGSEVNTHYSGVYTFLALTAREKFIVSYHTGSRSAENTETFVSDFANRIDGRIQITSDSWRPYPHLIRKYLLDRLDYATMQKIYASDYDARGDAARRYSPPQCIGVRVRVRAGEPRPDRINTSFVERVNLSVRHFNKRFARLGLGYSRNLENHKAAVSLFTASYNWCKVHSTLGTTPAHGVKLADKPWKIEELLEAACA